MAATLAGMVIEKLGFSEANIITVYILSVLATSVIVSKRMYSLIFSVVNVVVFNFFFVTPKYSLTAYDSGYPITFLVMFLAAFITSSLAVRLKNHVKQSAQTAFRTQILFDTNQLLQQEKEKEGIVNITANQLIKLLSRDIVYYPVEKEQLREPKVFFGFKRKSRREMRHAKRERSSSVGAKEQQTCRCDHGHIVRGEVPLSGSESESCGLWNYRNSSGRKALGCF